MPKFYVVFFYDGNENRHAFILANNINDATEAMMSRGPNYLLNGWVQLPDGHGEVWTEGGIADDWSGDAGVMP